MFTGLIRTQGRLVMRSAQGTGARLSLAYLNNPLQVSTGDSVAVNGVCLTVLEPDQQGFSADLSAETLGCTTLGGLADGVQLNLESAMSLADRLDGHLVTGHVDAIGTVREVIDADDSALVWFNAPDSLLPLIAAKGSIAVDGVSLTVNEADNEGFRVQLIQHTMEVTGFGSLKAGQQVNLEADLIARYVARLARFGSGNNGKIPI